MRTRFFVDALGKNFPFKSLIFFSFFLLPTYCVPTPYNQLGTWGTEGVGMLQVRQSMTANYESLS